ncbi:MAG: TonB-dependent receptor [Candidatus Marinimicrobia bacterium]|nr:TonB-dependent receptor [Candidatus Neomarinimicrobiota bacterium]
MKRQILIIAIILSLTSLVFAKDSKIKGFVLTQSTKKPIKEALVVLEDSKDDDFKMESMTDKNGYFEIRHVPVGVYKIAALKDGFFSNSLFDLKIHKTQTYNLKIKLIECKGKQNLEFCFMIGGIEVEAQEKEIIPDEVATTRKISSGEVEHMQASSLGDVLSLVPGVEKSNNPGLSKSSKVGLRSVSITGTAGVMESFGSTLIVDENVMSDDGNASSSGRGGIDLRTIPADNIESVEVITGIPSVEYGNFANGIIKVKTKSGSTSPKLKAKLNPDTKTASFSNGHKLGKSVFDYHLNYGFSERNLRIQGDEYHRIYAKGTYSSDEKFEKLNLKINSSFTKTLDNEEATGPWKTRDYDHGYRAMGNMSAKYDKSKNIKYNFYFGTNLNNKKQFKEKWVNDQIIVEIDTVFYDTTGTGEIIENDTTYKKMEPGYIGQKSVIGQSWSLNGKFQRRVKRTIGSIENNFLSGIEFDYDTDNGEGLTLDSSRNYYGLYSGKRSYSYDDYDALTSWSAYVEDKINGKIFNLKYNLLLGLRYDLFTPTELSLFKNDNILFESKHGDFLCPRFNFRLFFSDNFRIRLGAGKTAKAISLGYIYKAPDYYQYADGDSTITEIQQQQNLDLQAYTTNKYEASIDWKPFDLFGMSFTFYHNESDNRPSTQSYPWGYETNNDTITSQSYSIYRNDGWNKSSGAEFTLRTKRIKNVKYKMNITYRYSESGKHGLSYDSSPDTSWEDIWYLPTSGWREKVIIDNQLSFVSKRLGVWVTLDVQIIPYYRRQTIYNGNFRLDHYYDSYDVTDIQYQGMTYYYDNKILGNDSHWRADLRITKSLTQNTEMSLYINNLLDDKGISVHEYTGSIGELNPDIFYGLEISTQF